MNYFLYRRWTSLWANTKMESYRLFWTLDIGCIFCLPILMRCFLFHPSLFGEFDLTIKNLKLFKIFYN